MNPHRRLMQSLADIDANQQRAEILNNKKNRLKTFADAAMCRLRPFWVSWHEPSRSTRFKSRMPWYRDGDIICAAVIASSPEAAKDWVVNAHSPKPTSLQWRFCDVKPVGWAPWHLEQPGQSRFPWSKWMNWWEDPSLNKADV
jgi:hypothetical protein